MRDRTAKNLSSLHTILYRITGGFVGRRLVNNDMLLLSTVGRYSGKTHTVPLLYLREGEDLVVIASWGGRDHHPEWYLNLQAEPRATVQILGGKSHVEARTTRDTERTRLWNRVVTAYDGYHSYQSRTEREIPVVILSQL
jgi:deazaflavin-dependent oxidoreductase (nitroreductase family)